MLNDEQIEDLLFAIHSLLEGNGLTPHGIKKYKYLEQTLLDIKRGTHLTPDATEVAKAPRFHSFACPECGRLGRVLCEPPLR